MSNQTENNNTRETIAAVNRFNAAFNDHDLDAVMEAMTENCVFESTNPAPDGARVAGQADMRVFWQNFFQNNPDAIFETEEMFAVENRCVVRWIYRKTKNGEPWHLRGVDVFRVENGKVAEKLAYVKG